MIHVTCDVLTGAKLIPMVTNRLLTPDDYDRDIRHYEFDLKDSGMSYSVGDCLGIYPHNDKQEVRNVSIGAHNLQNCKPPSSDS